MKYSSCICKAIYRICDTRYSVVPDLLVSSCTEIVKRTKSECGFVPAATWIEKEGGQEVAIF